MKTKQLLGVFALIAMLSFFSLNANAQSDNGLIGKARGELAQCINDYPANDWEVFGAVAVVNCVTQPCPIAKEATIWVCPICNPNNPNDICSRRPCIQIGTVSFDAQGHIVDSRSICD